MRAVVQRVSSARVTATGDAPGAVAEETGRIAAGLLVLLGAMDEDGPDDLAWLAKKILALRIFPDEEGKMNRSVVEVGGSILLVSQFTVCADVGKGTRPSFARARRPDEAEAMLGAMKAELARAVPVATGRFGAHMAVELVNDGPVTIWLDSWRGRAHPGSAE